MLSFKKYLKEDFEQLKELKDFKLEVVCDEKSIAAGLSGRTSIAPDGGMLFILPESEVQCFWMANCLVEMDIIFLDSQTRVTAMHQMKVEPPRSPYETNAAYENRLPQYSSGRPAQFVIELAAGTLDRLGIRVNSRINLAEYLREDAHQLDEILMVSWWYNSRTKKSVKITGNFFIHADVIVEAPEKLGLTDKDVFSVSGTKTNDVSTRIFFADILADLLKRKGWAQLTINTKTSRGDEAVIRAESSRESQRTLKWILDNFSPTLENVFISNNKAPKSISLKGHQAVNQFAKTGKVVRLSPLAAFR